MIKFKLTKEGIRKVCIENNYYTLETNEDYSRLLSKHTLKEVDVITSIDLDDMLKDVATNILAHTEDSILEFADTEESALATVYEQLLHEVIVYSDTHCND